MTLSRNILKSVGESRHPSQTPTIVQNQSVGEDCSSGLVIEVFDDLDKVGADELLHGCPQSCMPNPVEGLLWVYEDMVEVLLLLEIFLTQELLYGAPSCSEACLFFSDDLFRLLLISLFSMIFSSTLLW